MEHLSEHTIKKAALSFFKTYYKFRPRVGETKSSFDLETSDGIIVDGSLSFLQENGLTFLATFETTSRATKDEVIFKIQSKILLWDSLAVSFLLASLFAVYSFYYDHFTVSQIGWIGSISLMIGVFGVAFLTYQYLFQWLRRYRYIYAVEQFKRYHADEQWIAIAEDVFETEEDTYFEELYEQCVRNGFGLVVVDKQLKTEALITPSREAIFGKKRDAMNFSNRDFARQRSKRERVKRWWDTTFAKLIKPNSKRSLLRYQRSYWNQILLCLASLLIICSIFYKESLDTEIAYADEEKYEKDLSKIAKTTAPETKDFIVDTPYVEPVKRKTEPYILVTKEEVPTEVFTEKGSHSEVLNNEYPVVEILVTTLDGDFVVYDCERFFNYSGTKYLIQEGEYPSIDKARQRIEQLSKKDINANCMWTGCFTQEEPAYIVFIDLLFDESDEAILIARSFQRKFKFASDALLIRPISLQKI